MLKQEYTSIQEISSMNLRPFLISTIATCTLGLGSVAPVFAQARSGCEANLIAKDSYAQINVRSGPGTEYSSPHYGVVGDRVIILRGNVDGFAIARDRNGARWVKVEFSKSRARGWIRRDFLSGFSC
mgnify:FL=1